MKINTVTDRRQFLQRISIGSLALASGTMIFKSGKSTAKPGSVPVAGEYDVIVCGGGTSGLPAAVGAARQGARVAIIERYGFIGGVPAYCIMPAWDDVAENQSGLLTDFTARVSDFGFGPDPLENRHIEPEVVKYLFLKMAEEAGVKLHLHQLLTGVLKEGNRVVGVITESKSGRRIYIAKTFVDASGDGDLVYHAGADYMMGENGKVQGMTLRFRLGWVNLPKYLDWVMENAMQYIRGRSKSKIESLKKRALEEKDFWLGTNMSKIWENDPDPELPRKTYFVMSSIRPNEISINSTRIYDVDGTNVDDLAKAEITCRKQAWAILKYLRKNIPGFEKAVMIETAAQIGVRESRSILGDYVLTDPDMRATREFEDSVMTSQVGYDAHDKKKYTTFHIRGGMVDIPYRCFLPKGIEGVTVAGRCLSSDHLANSGIRQMRTAFQSGEVSGIAAALAAKKGTAQRNLDLPFLLEELKKVGFLTSQKHRMQEGRHLMQILKRYEKEGRKKW